MTSAEMFMLRRKAVNVAMLSLTGVFTVLTAGLLLFILGYLFWYGGRSVNWAFLTELPKPVGEEGGGMANAIVGSGKILGLATLIGFPVGFLAGVYLSEYGTGYTSSFIRYVTDLLNGVPSIVMGVFVYTIAVLPVKHFSAYAGAIALGIMMVPIAVRSTEEYLRAVPNELREAALALGAPKWRVIVSIVIPAAASGILTALMLGVARVAGETAPLLFTSFGNQYWSKGMDQPTSTLPVMIFQYAVSPYDDWHRQAWAAGFVLLISILIINTIARFLVSRRFSHKSR
ncbi:MAG TPA: phosphate ABC transporter permease PstA [Planctomycetota bacterium]|nr:phosphate ABC transporter permease PstA [Planctomycetota bacterium]